MTSSLAYSMSEDIQYENLTKRVEDDGTKLRDLRGAFRRYADSKLANIYFAAELDRRLRERGCEMCTATAVILVRRIPMS